jgi:hypothetical protein
MNAEAPTATAIVLNFNGRGFVCEAVASLLAQDLPRLEVVVVDNGSSDGSAEEIEARFGARVRVIRNGRNLGWGAGNNVGIQATRGRHVILLNNDAVAAPGFARELLAAAAADASIGMVAAKLLEVLRRDVIDSTGHLLYPDGLNRGRGRLETDRGQYDALRTALFPSGAGALYLRAMLDQIGLFEESFFLYGDDAELGLRARLAGWGCGFAPRAVARHHYSRSAGAYSALKAFHVERNRIWIVLRLFPPSLMIASIAYTAARMLYHAAAAFTGQGAAAHLAREASAFTLLAVTLRAWASALWGVPGQLRARRRLGASRRLQTAEFRSLLREFRLSAREAAFKD